MTIREFFSLINTGVDLGWQSFLDLDIVWTLKIVGLFGGFAWLVLWLVIHWLREDEQRAAQERARQWRDEFDA